MTGGGSGAGADESTARLHGAAREGLADKASEALANGAGINVLDEWGLTALHSAALGGHIDLIAVLLERRAAIDAPTSRGQTALHLAVTNGHEGVVQLLIEKRVDATLATSHGIMAVELAAQKPEIEKMLKEELSRRWDQADADIKELQSRLQSAEAARGLLEGQLGSFIDSKKGIKTSVFRTSSERARPTDSAKSNKRSDEPAPSYWRSGASAMNEMRARAEDAMQRSWLRAPPLEKDPYPWKGEVNSSHAVMPVVDPEDDDLVKSFDQLRMAADENHRREARRAAAAGADGAASLAEKIEGKTLSEWERLVDELRQPTAEWSWSKVEVRQRESIGAEDSEEVVPLTGVFAVGPASAMAKKAVVFEAGELVGPLGGVFRRKSRYEELHYPGHKWVFHDPHAFQLTLRAQHTELKLEPLVLDLCAGNTQNRLRHLADVRHDPLGLKELLVGSSKPASSEPLLPPRRWSAMPRVRSRPNSPSREGEEAPKEDQVSPACEGATAPPLREANMRLVEMHVKGWPFVFAIAARDILNGEELTLDHGEAYWEAQRSALLRLKELGRISREMVAGVDLEDDALRSGSKEEPFAPRERRPMPRPEKGW